MSDIEVFWGSGSQPSWRVLLALEVKGLKYLSHLISFTAGDHKKPEFLRLNPRHRVPVLKDGDFILYESLAILAYLDRKFPDKPLFGKTPEETGLVWREISEFQSDVEPALVDGVVRPIFFNRVEESRGKIEESLVKVHEELSRYEATLSKRHWLVGDALSAADIAIFPQLMALLRAATRPAAVGLKLNLLPFEETYPGLAAWMARIEAVPGYANTYPPHWR
jgi:glutathione S-transferase